MSIINVVVGSVSKIGVLLIGDSVVVELVLVVDFSSWNGTTVVESNSSISVGSSS